MKLLDGKTVLVTGASTGIGRAIAIGAAEHGANVVINYARDTAGAASCVEQIKSRGMRGLAIQGDVADPATASIFVERAVDAFGQVDVMVSNAGICPFHSFLDMPVEVVDRTMQVNLHGGYYMAQAAARQMVAQGKGGSIIAVSSISALVGGEFQTHYTPTKAGLHSLMQSAAIALGKHGIRCNSLLPGTILTEINKEDLADAKKREYMEKRTPLGRLGQPEDMVGPTVFLASDMAAYVTGAALLVDGGMFREPAMSPRVRKAASALDYRELARRRLPPFLFEYIDGGSYAEVTLKRNVADLEAIALRQRVLNDVSSIDLTTEIFGQKLALPVGLAPIGLAGMNARRGEVQAARAAEAAGIPFCLSTVSACPLDEVAANSRQPFWFQLYMIRDRGFMRELIERAKALGCSALVFTVDMPVPGSRYRDYHSGLAGAPGLGGALRRVWQGATHPGWAWDVGVNGRPHQLGNVAPVLGKKTGLEDFFAWMRNNFDPSVSWRDLDFIRETWSGPLIIKGILDAEDARKAADIGADGIVVSNHGGRQLDGVPSTARALPPIADAVGDRLTVLADGGIRSGLDVVRMLALGAKGVLLGRAWIYALAGGGEAGVTHMLRLFEAEMRVAMALTGRTSIAGIDRSALVV